MPKITKTTTSPAEGRSALEPPGAVRAMWRGARIQKAFWWIMAGGWAARRREARRAWGGMFALTSLAMLFVSPLAWTHYFLWWVGALVVLAHRRRLLLAVGAVSMVGLFSVPARGLGVHMWLSVVLYAAVVYDLWRRPTGSAPAPAAR